VPAAEETPMADGEFAAEEMPMVGEKFAAKETSMADEGYAAEVDHEQSVAMTDILPGAPSVVLAKMLR